LMPKSRTGPGGFAAAASRSTFSRCGEGSAGSSWRKAPWVAA
jgi:hypothetical protein